MQKYHHEHHHMDSTTDIMLLHKVSRHEVSRWWGWKNNDMPGCDVMCCAVHHHRTAPSEYYFYYITSREQYEVGPVQTPAQAVYLKRKFTVPTIYASVVHCIAWT